MDNQWSHLWIMAPYQRDREHALQAMNQKAAVFSVINCHRNLRGPYTGTGELLRNVVPTAYQQYPELVIAHGTEILTIAPELKSLTIASTQTLTSEAVGEERTIYYSHLRTQRLAHGIVDFLLEYIAATNQETPSTIVFDNVHLADALDQELLSILLRRAVPQQLMLTIGSASTALAEPLLSVLTAQARLLQLQPQHEQAGKETEWRIPDQWEQWLLQQTEGWRGEWEPFQSVAEQLATIAAPMDEMSFAQGVQYLLEQLPATLLSQKAQAYINTDCTSDNPIEKAAYDLLEGASKQQFHDTRAAALEEQEPWTLHLGAIPLHREHGTEPEETGVRTLQAALDYCLDMAFYEAAVDFGYRGRKLFDWEQQLDRYWALTWNTTTALTALERGAEAEGLFDEIRELTSNPVFHMHAAYGTAMLYTRHLAPERRNLHVAKRWAQEAIAISKLLPDPKERAFRTVFHQNGLALIEVRLGRPLEAQRLVVEGLERLNRELEPEEHKLQRSVMLYNRAQVNNVLGKLDAALADFTTLIAQDPHYSEYYFDRGNMYRRLKRNEEALEDYNAAIRYGPPYPEVYYNRAGLLSILGREDEALADYTYVLELEPDHIDALINRASILYESGEYSAARSDSERGLALSPGNAQLLCTLGLVEMEEQHLEEAQQAFTTALERDPTLVAAWTNRAIVAFEQGNADAAIADLSHALERGDSATVLYNRGYVYQSQERWQEAIDDYTRTLALSNDDAQDILYQRGICYVKLGNDLLARQDFAAHLALGDSDHEEEIRQAIPGYPRGVPIGVKLRKRS